MNCYNKTMSERPRPVEQSELHHNPFRDLFTPAPQEIQRAVETMDRGVLEKERPRFSAQIFPEVILEPRRYQEADGTESWGTRIRVPVPLPQNMVFSEQNAKRRQWEEASYQVNDPISEHNMQVSEQFANAQRMRHALPGNQTLYNTRVALSSMYEFEEEDGERQFIFRINNDTANNPFAGWGNPSSELACFTTENTNARQLWRGTPGELVPTRNGKVLWPEGFWGKKDTKHGAHQEFKRNALGIFGLKPEDLSPRDTMPAEYVDFKPLNYQTRTSVALDYSAWGKNRVEELAGVYALISPNTVEIVKPIEIPPPDMMHDTLHRSQSVAVPLITGADWAYRKYIQNQPDARLPFRSIYDSQLGRKVDDPAIEDEIARIKASPPMINYLNMIFHHHDRVLNKTH